MASMSMRQMLEAGVHFGHQTRFWNPKMAQFIFGERNRIHIINLEKTLPLYNEAAGFIRQVVADGGHVLFVGTKRSAREAIATGGRALRHALRQPSLARRHAHEFQDRAPVDQAPRRARRDGGERHARSSTASAKRRGCAASAKSSSAASAASRKWTALPDVLFVIDVGHEKIAIHEAKKLGIPVVAIVDTNCAPDDVDYVIPGQRRRDARDPAVCRRHRRRRARRPFGDSGSADRRRRVRRARRGRQAAAERRAVPSPQGGAGPQEDAGAPQAGREPRRAASEDVVAAEVDEVEPEECAEEFMARRKAARKRSRPPLRCSRSRLLACGRLRLRPRHLLSRRPARPGANDHGRYR